jgi:hypothetical protein
MRKWFSWSFLHCVNKPMCESGEVCCPWPHVAVRCSSSSYIRPSIVALVLLANAPGDEFPRRIAHETLPLLCRRHS